MTAQVLPPAAATAHAERVHALPPLMAASPIVSPVARITGTEVCLICADPADRILLRTLTRTTEMAA